MRTQEFTLLAECFLRPESNSESIRLQADALRGAVDAVLLTDNQHGQLHMSTIAAARLMLDSGIDPVVQLSCRNRNRIVLISDMLGAAALGVTSLLLVRGARVPEGFNPRPKAVFDLNATELIATAAKINAYDSLPSPPDFLIGGIVKPHSPKTGWVPTKIIEKLEAGAHFLVTPICMDMSLLRAYMEHLVANKLTRRVSIIVSTAVLSSAEDARLLRKNRPNVAIPDDLIERLDTAGGPVKEGVTICGEQLAEIRDIPGVSGANIMATTDLSKIAEAVAVAGLRK